tara:strand:+ start:5305 stop:6024 length:720 start_codon:yes stop_codon:yes gene_type:complete
MLLKIFIIYSILFYLFHTLDEFNSYNKLLYSDFYVDDKTNIRGLMYEPYDFTDIKNIILSLLATPYGLTIIMLSLIVITIGYISYKWFIIFTFICYVILIIGHNIVLLNTEKSILLYYMVRISILLLPLFSLLYSAGVSVDTVKVYREQSGMSFVIIMILILLEYIVTYNYDPSLGKYTVKNKEDYEKIYKPKWIFISQILPMYIMLFIILRNYVKLTNTFILSFSLLTYFSIFSYIFY